MAVPDTTTFTLQNVVDEVNPTTDDLVDCFADADLNSFDPAYYDTGNDLLEFRNYGGGGTIIASPDTLTWNWDENPVSKTSDLTITPDATFYYTKYGDTDKFTVTVDQVKNQIYVQSIYGNIGVDDWVMTINVYITGFANDIITCTQYHQ